MSRFIDLAYEQDDEGVFDLVFEDGDCVTTDGLETAVVCSVLSDRRAYADEVPDPMKRRGWIGDLVSSVPGDRHGSGLWLYEQTRGTADKVLGVRIEGEQCLMWMVQEGLFTNVSAQAVFTPAARRIALEITTESPAGGTSVWAFDLAQATRDGLLAKLGAV